MIKCLAVSLAAATIVCAADPPAKDKRRTTHAKDEHTLFIKSRPDVNRSETVKASAVGFVDF